MNRLGISLALAFGLAPPLVATPRLKRIPGGSFEMGCAGCNLTDALPVHTVQISPFLLMDAPVTNSEFAAFSSKNHYVTMAEQPPSAIDYPSAPAHMLTAGSGVFTPPHAAPSMDNALDWWTYVPGASWQHPEGPRSSINRRKDHPVVHIAYVDAETYCRGMGMRLPTEAEFEYAARGGLIGKKYAWGDALKPAGKWAANVWQGKFPVENSADDGYVGTSPVRAFSANGFGLYDMGGNVWQWTSDWYRPDYYQELAAQGKVVNPRGPRNSFDPQEPGVAKHVQRGGSYLCSDRYCTRYLVGSRGKGAADSAGSNTGFRCAKDLKGSERI